MINDEHVQSPSQTTNNERTTNNRQPTTINQQPQPTTNNPYRCHPERSEGAPLESDCGERYNADVEMDE
jgi:hypothetical protein